MRRQRALSAGELGRWLGTARAALLVREERRLLAEVLPGLFGRTLLQIGNWAGGMLNLAAHWRTGVVGGFRDANAHVVCDLQSLPLVRHSVDAIVLPHSLENAVSPLQLLRETDRTLTSRGQLIIMGFNPFSWWGLRQRGWPGLRPLPRDSRPISAGRVCEWLSVLDYEIVRFERYGPGLRQWPRLLRRGLQSFACGYLIVARKRTVPITPVRQLWKERRPAINAAGVPSARSSLRERS